MDTELVVRTSEKLWAKTLADAYDKRTALTLVDDAGVGIDPTVQSLLAMGIHAKLTAQEWVAVGVGLGMSAAGVMMVVFSFLDPEPTSKLGLMVGGGTICILGGGFGAIRVLTKQRPPNVTVSPRGFEIKW
jgi:hypothetical protein